MINKFEIFISTLWWNILVNFIGKSILLPNELRYIIFKIAGMRTNTSKIRSGCMFRGKSVYIGKGVLINHNVFIDAWNTVRIKENTSIACGVKIITSSHKIGSRDKRAGDSERKPVVIGRGCWIGANSVILPGVNIGDGCVIAAGSVVTKDCNSNTMYAGVPAKEIKLLD